jgi:NAD+ diphosphatase
MHTPPGFAPAHRLPAVLPGTALGFAYSGTRLVVRGSVESPVIPTLAELDAAGLAGDRHYLGEIDGVPCISIALANIEEPPPGFAMAGLRSFFFRLPDPLLAIAARAFQIADWDRSHRYCGRCGARTRDGDGERAKECPSCGLVAYPRVSPAMMALVTRGRALLLARSARFASGVYSALAGFVEPGETIEDCIRREVREEVGIEVGEPVYFASQSWAFPHSLMIAYTVEYAGGEIRLDDPEIEDARWFALDALPKLPPSVSIARRLIDATVERLRAS